MRLAMNSAMIVPPEVWPIPHSRPNASTIAMGSESVMNERTKFFHVLDVFIYYSKLAMCKDPNYYYQTWGKAPKLQIKTPQK